MLEGGSLLHGGRRHERPNHLLLARKRHEVTLALARFLSAAANPKRPDLLLPLSSRETLTLNRSQPSQILGPLFSVDYASRVVSSGTRRTTSGAWTAVYP